VFEKHFTHDSHLIFHHDSFQLKELRKENKFKNLIEKITAATARYFYTSTNTKVS